MLKNKLTLIFDADPFCFGPISTTLYIVEQLKSRKKIPEDCKLVLLGTLTTTQLAEKSGLFDEIYECIPHPKQCINIDHRCTYRGNKLD